MDQIAMLKQSHLSLLCLNVQLAGSWILTFIKEKEVQEGICFNESQLFSLFPLISTLSTLINQSFQCFVCQVCLTLCNINAVVAILE